jgi:alpha-beta hydrolase superfamily lysophospholipase
MRNILLIVIFQLVLPASSWDGLLIAQEVDQSVTGKWYGVLDLKVQKLRLEIRVRENDGGYSGGMVSLDQASSEFPFERLEMNDNKMVWAIKSLNASFEGDFNESWTEVAGTFKQGPIVADLVLKKITDVPQRKLAETWQGEMVAGPQSFEFQFRVFKDADGEETVLLDSFTENIAGLNCVWSREGPTVRIEIPATAAEFVGEINDAEDEIVGSWIQRGNEIPLTINLVASAATRKLTLKRPQTPQPPFDYVSEDLEIDNPAGNSVLAGTLTLPPGEGPFPLVILISGSGPQDRDETIFGHKPFFVIADHLTKKGIAVFRFDDRGIGKSKGNFAAATSRDFASDVEAIVADMKSRQRIDPQRIVLAGHSEGGIIAPMVALNNEVAGIILLAGTGVTGKEISLNQSRNISKLAGIPKPVLDAQERVLVEMYDRMEAGEKLDAPFVESLVKEINQSLPAETRSSANVQAIAEAARVQLSSPWFGFFAFHDPAPVLARVEVPVLVVIGEKDTQVDADLNVPPIEAALKKAGNRDVVIKRMPGLNHLFQSCQTGSPAEYQIIEQTISPQVLEILTEWIKARFGRSR